MTNVTEDINFVFQRIENNVGKEENPGYHGKRRKCWLPAFSPFSTMISKGIFLWAVKIGISW